MEKKISLFNNMLSLSGAGVDVGEYQQAMVGLYTPKEIEQRRVERIYTQLKDEGLILPKEGDLTTTDTTLIELGRKQSNRRKELSSEIQSDNYTKYMVLLYGTNNEVGLDGLQQKISALINSDPSIKGSIDVKVHYDRLVPIIGRITSNPPPKDGIEIMATKDVHIDLTLTSYF